MSVANPGDIVRVIHCGHRYPNYGSFLAEQGFPELVRRFTGNCKNNDVGRVLFSGKHVNKINILYAVELDLNSRIVVIGTEGIEKVTNNDSWNKPIEVSEIPIANLLGI